MSYEIDNQARIKKLESLYTKIKQRTEKTIVSDTEPESPTLGLQWFDTTELAFKIWGGREWETTTVKSLSVGATPNWFRVDENGNMWSGRDTLALAQANTFAVLNTGKLYAYDAYIRGNIQATSATFGYASSSSVGGVINKGFTTSNIGATTAPTTGVKIDNSGIKMYSGGVQKVGINSDGSATFTGTITASQINGSSIIGGFFRTYEDENQSYLEIQDNEIRFYTLEGPGGSQMMRQITTGLGTGILLSGGTTIDTKLKIPVGTNLY